MAEWTLEELEDLGEFGYESSVTNAWSIADIMDWAEEQDLSEGPATLPGMTAEERLPGYFGATKEGREEEQRAYERSVINAEVVRQGGTPTEFYTNERGEVEERPASWYNPATDYGERTQLPSTGLEWMSPAFRDITREDSALSRNAKQAYQAGLGSISQALVRSTDAIADTFGLSSPMSALAGAVYGDDLPDVSPNLADDMNREAGRPAEAADVRSGRDWIPRTARNVGSSFTQAAWLAVMNLVTGGKANPLALQAAGAAATSGSSAITDGKDKGLEGASLYGYAGLVGGVEGVLTAAFGKISGGKTLDGAGAKLWAETVGKMSREIVKDGTAKVAKEVGKKATREWMESVGWEGLEETSIYLLQHAAGLAFDVEDPKSVEQYASDLRDLWAASAVGTSAMSMAQSGVSQIQAGPKEYKANSMRNLYNFIHNPSRKNYREAYGEKPTGGREQREGRVEPAVDRYAQMAVQNLANGRPIWGDNAPGGVEVTPRLKAAAWSNARQIASEWEANGRDISDQRVTEIMGMDPDVPGFGDAYAKHVSGYLKRQELMEAAKAKDERAAEAERKRVDRRPGPFQAKEHGPGRDAPEPRKKSPFKRTESKAAQSKIEQVAEEMGVSEDQIREWATREAEERAEAGKEYDDSMQEIGRLLGNYKSKLVFEKQEDRTARFDEAVDEWNSRFGQNKTPDELRQEYLAWEKTSDPSLNDPDFLREAAQNQQAREAAAAKPTEEPAGDLAFGEDMGETTFEFGENVKESPSEARVDEIIAKRTTRPGNQEYEDKYRDKVRKTVAEEEAALEKYPPGTDLYIKGYPDRPFRVMEDGTLKELIGREGEYSIGRQMGDNAGEVLRKYKPGDITVIEEGKEKPTDDLPRKRSLNKELQPLSNEELEWVRQNNTDSSTRRRAKKILKSRGVEITSPGKVEGGKKKARGRVLEVDEEVAEKVAGEMDAAEEALSLAGAKLTHRSKSGSSYWKLPNGEAVRVSDHDLPPSGMRDKRESEPWDHDIVLKGKLGKDGAKQAIASIVEEKGIEKEKPKKPLASKKKPATQTKKKPAPKKGIEFKEDTGEDRTGVRTRLMHKDGKQVGHTAVSTEDHTKEALTDFPDAPIKEGDKVSRIKDVYLEDDLHGQGLGRKLYLDMLSDGEWYWNKQISAPAATTLVRLERDGLIEAYFDGDWASEMLDSSGKPIPGARAPKYGEHLIRLAKKDAPKKEAPSKADDMAKAVDEAIERMADEDLLLDKYDKAEARGFFENVKTDVEFDAAEAAVRARFDPANEELSEEHTGQTEDDAFDYSISERKPGAPRKTKRTKSRFYPLTPAEELDLQPSQEGKPPISIDATIRKIAKTIGFPIRKGRVKTGANGHHQRSTGEIRVDGAKAGDIGLIVHEAAHSIDNQSGIRKEIGEKYHNELKSFTKQETKGEGFAEYVRMTIRNRASAESLAPGFTMYFHGSWAAANPDAYKQVIDIQSHYRDYYDQGASRHVRAQIAPAGSIPNQDEAAEYEFIYGPTVMTKRMRKLGVVRGQGNEAWQWIDRTYRKFFIATMNRQDPIKKTQRRAALSGHKKSRAGEGGMWETVVSVSNKSAELAKAWTMEDGVYVDRGEKGREKVSGSLASIYKKGIKPKEGDSYDEFAEFLVARAVLESSVKRPDLNLSVDPEQAKRSLEIMLRDKPDSYKRYEDTHKGFVDWSNSVLETIEAAGFLEKDVKEQLLEMHRNYVPMYRVKPGQSSGKLAGQKGPAVPRRKGGVTYEIMDPVQGYYLKALRTAKTLEQIEIERSIITTLDPANGGVEGFSPIFQRLEDRAKPTRAHLAELMDGLRKEGIIDGDLAKIIIAKDKALNDPDELTLPMRQTIGRHYQIPSPKKNSSKKEVEVYDKKIRKMLKKDNEIPGMDLAFKYYRNESSVDTSKGEVMMSFEGEARTYYMAKPLIDAYYKSGMIGGELSEAALAGAQVLTNSIKAGATGFNPGFLGVNFFWDWGQLFWTSKHMTFKDVAVDVPKALALFAYSEFYGGVMKKGKWAKKSHPAIADARESGLIHSTWVGSGDSGIRHMGEKITGGKRGFFLEEGKAPWMQRIRGGIGRRALTVLDAVKFAASISEFPVRFAEHQAAYRTAGYEFNPRTGRWEGKDGPLPKGWKPPKSASMKAAFASTSTMNFQQQGAVTQPLNAVYPYLTASLLGPYRVIESINDTWGKDSWNELTAHTNTPIMRKRQAQMAMVMFLGTAAYIAASANDDRYKKLTDEERAKSYHFWPMGFHFKLPKIHGFRSPFNLMEAYISSVVEDDPTRFSTAGWTEFKAMAAPFALGMPAMFKASAEVEANRDYWGRKIQKDNFRFYHAAQRNLPTTTETAKFVARIARIGGLFDPSGAEVEHYFNSFTGGAWKRNVEDFEAAVRGELLNPEIYPIVGGLTRRFFPEAGGRPQYSRAVQTFYTQKTEITKDRNQAIEEGTLTPKLAGKYKHFNDTAALAQEIWKLTKEETDKEKIRQYAEYRVGLTRWALELEPFEKSQNPIANYSAMMPKRDGSLQKNESVKPLLPEVKEIVDRWVMARAAARTKDLRGPRWEEDPNKEIERLGNLESSDKIMSATRLTQEDMRALAAEKRRASHLRRREKIQGARKRKRLAQKK